MKCEECGAEIQRQIEGYELCIPCYQKALENQRLLWQELADWVRKNKLYELYKELPEIEHTAQ